MHYIEDVFAIHPDYDPKEDRIIIPAKGEPATLKDKRQVQICESTHYTYTSEFINKILAFCNEEPTSEEILRKDMLRVNKKTSEIISDINLIEIHPNVVVERILALVGKFQIAGTRNYIGLCKGYLIVATPCANNRVEIILEESGIGEEYDVVFSVDYSVD